MGIADLTCYPNFLLSINLITSNTSKFLIHAVLIQEIKDLFSQANYSFHHTLREVLDPQSISEVPRVLFRGPRGTSLMDWGSKTAKESKHRGLFCI
ncbi:hypothetical protein MTR_6g011820 [Medicago truncatula]|uniref:Uncharacterized protein n=1 Tax=Medicago truncatula TaxID=3880 RepID=A0A072U7B8_MEDTR|nr:hypothetical protein MTR_6g011820 [Medicago truncatula]